MPQDGLFGGLCGVTPRGVVHHGSETFDCGAGRVIRISAADAVVELQIGGGRALAIRWNVRWKPSRMTCAAGTLASKPPRASMA